MNRGNFILEAKFPSNSSNGNASLTRQHQYKIDAFKFLFGNIAAFSFLGNLLLSMTICRRRQLLLKTYNLLVLNLAITDMLTGLFPVRVSVCCCNWLYDDFILFYYFIILCPVSMSSSGSKSAIVFRIIWFATCFNVTL